MVCTPGNRFASRESQRRVMLISSQKTKVFIFDWDGTVFDSMQIKFQTFSKTLSQMLKVYVEDSYLYFKIEDSYKKLSGWPRKEIFKNILESFNVPEDTINYSQFSESLSQVNREQLEKKKIFPDAKFILERLVEMKKTIFISSSLPQSELDYFTSRKLDKGVLGAISNILGSDSCGFSKGEEHFKFIQEKMGCGRNEMLFIGDDLKDYQLSKESRVFFALIDREDKFQHLDVSRIMSLTALGDVIS